VEGLIPLVTDAARRAIPRGATAKSHVQLLNGKRCAGGQNAKSHVQLLNGKRCAGGQIAEDNIQVFHHPPPTPPTHPPLTDLHLQPTARLSK
jgi:hypothetical protein